MTTRKLPNRIINIVNQDKTWHEQPSDDLGTFPHPFRAIFISSPGGGKTLAIKNILIRTDPPFDNILLIHADLETKEYSDLDLCYFDSKIPSIEEMNIDSTKKSLIIIEDLDYHNLLKEEKSNLNLINGCFSTHKSLSVMMTCQNPFSIPAGVRRMCTVLCLWKGHDANCLTILSSRFGINAKDLRHFFDHIVNDTHDFLVIDTHRDRKLRLRKNLFTPIEYNP